jgi:uncharacterized membrane protein
MGDALAAATLATAVGAALVAGVFLGFSALVMPALARGPAAEGIAVMRRINRAAVGPGLMIPFLATSAGCAALAVIAIVDWGEPHAPWLLAGSLLYLLGALLLTGAYHQPRNLALDAVDPSAPDAAARWTRYLRDWVPWNHVRGAAGLAAAIALVIAFRVG